MTANTLIVGGGGMLARAFGDELKKRGAAFRSVDVPEIDLRDAASIERALQPGDALVINCAAWTDVDGAEALEEEATAVNGTGVGALAARCKQVGAVLVHFSTDYVFDGEATEPYTVEHPRAPISAYGRSKAVGEQLLEDSGAEHLLIRTSWLYAPWGKNIVITLRNLMAKRPELRVVDDQIGRPTSAQYLVERTFALIDMHARGTFHVTNGGQCSWHGFAAAIASHEHAQCRVLPCTTAEYLAEFPRPAKRPAYSVFDLSKTEALIGPSLDWRESLYAVLRQL